MSKLQIKNRYAITPNELLNNKEISLKAKGLFGFLQSKPDNWSFSIERIAKQTKDGKDGIRTAILELEKSKYLQRKPRKNSNGEWDGYDYILADKPLTENPTTVKPTTENTHTLSKKDNSKKDIVKKNNIRETNFNKNLSPTDKNILLKEKTTNFISTLNSTLKGIELNEETSAELKSFISYWTEPNRSKTKLKWELERTWDTKRRLNTWMRNNEKWGKKEKKIRTIEL